ncbi:hypothetical protein SK128_021080 [Halocaridina rubra]|uniref:Uncharacterized protein n=1 Tax=Halocaridina rubra TaxID=373956 RepID=A0AAN8WV52_HALRR
MKNLRMFLGYLSALRIYGGFPFTLTKDPPAARRRIILLIFSAILGLSMLSVLVAGEYSNNHGMFTGNFLLDLMKRLMTLTLYPNFILVLFYCLVRGSKLADIAVRIIQINSEILSQNTSSACLDYVSILHIVLFLLFWVYSNVFGYAFQHTAFGIVILTIITVYIDPLLYLIPFLFHSGIRVLAHLIDFLFVPLVEPTAGKTNRIMVLEKSFWHPEHSQYFVGALSVIRQRLYVLDSVVQDMVKYFAVMLSVIVLSDIVFIISILSTVDESNLLMLSVYLSYSFGSCNRLFLVLSGPDSFMNIGRGAIMKNLYMFFGALGFLRILGGFPCTISRDPKRVHRQKVYFAYSLLLGVSVLGFSLAAEILSMDRLKHENIAIEVILKVVYLSCYLYITVILLVCIIKSSRMTRIIHQVIKLNVAVMFSSHSLPSLPAWDFVVLFHSVIFLGLESFLLTTAIVPQANIWINGISAISIAYILPLLYATVFVFHSGIRVLNQLLQASFEKMSLMTRRSLPLQVMPDENGSYNQGQQHVPLNEHSFRNLRASFEKISLMTGSSSPFQIITDKNSVSPQRQHVPWIDHSISHLKVIRQQLFAIDSIVQDLTQHFELILSAELLLEILFIIGLLTVLFRKNLLLVSQCLCFAMGNIHRMFMVVHGPHAFKRTRKEAKEKLRHLSLKLSSPEAKTEIDDLLRDLDNGPDFSLFGIFTLGRHCLLAVSL